MHNASGHNESHHKPEEHKEVFAAHPRSITREVPWLRSAALRPPTSPVHPSIAQRQVNATNHSGNEEGLIRRTAHPYLLRRNLRPVRGFKRTSALGREDSDRGAHALAPGSVPYAEAARRGAISGGAGRAPLGNHPGPGSGRHADIVQIHAIPAVAAHDVEPLPVMLQAKGPVLVVERLLALRTPEAAR